MPGVAKDRPQVRLGDISCRGANGREGAWDLRSQRIGAA